MKYFIETSEYSLRKMMQSKIAPGGIYLLPSEQICFGRSKSVTTEENLIRPEQFIPQRNKITFRDDWKISSPAE